MAAKVNPENVILHWACPVCNASFPMNADSLTESGTAVCPNCDVDCELESVEVQKDTKSREGKYLACGGVRCPHCGSKSIVGGEHDTQDTGIYQNIVCDGCGKQWTDEYTLTGVTLE